LLVVSLMITVDVAPKLPGKFPMGILARYILPLSPAKNRYMFVLSPMSVWSMGPVLEPEMVPEKSGCADDHPFAFVGSLDVL
jgi:hypothetical protein